MAALVATGIVSADGYVVDASGSFAWAEPDDEVHAFVNALERQVSTYLCGRRLYEVMSFWDAPPEGLSDVAAEFAAGWREADKIVVSTTLEAVDAPRTTLVRSFDPSLVTELPGVASIGGPTLASAAFEAGVVDEVQLLAVPHLAGGGTRFFPDGFSSSLTLLDERRFTGGTVYTRYRVG